ncbi:MAG TPA: tRNA (adenosine(37)-N6)-dimethylallyltransferase MiaA [Candidatus Competibacteraceae bacterium]|nr:tRNA (adenosine(37)-N6)-dimethylallyltransferase MiaA [Candidatus Competibacteraceae bacterium]
MQVTSAHPPAVFLMGPTASGKTDLAVKLAQHFPFALISVDSALVYREMDIGTAKPDPAILQAIPHRLVDILDPSESYSAAQFRADALREMQQIYSQGQIPLLVGGTMLYFRALQQGLSVLPSADPAVRADLSAELNRIGLAALHERLARLDAVAAARIHPHDTHRILRALEVHAITGRSLTELYARQRDESLVYKIVKLVIAPVDRQLLHRRIEQRFQRMLEQGFVAEVERLRGRGDLNLDKPSMRAVGYRQVWEYLEGQDDYPEMCRRVLATTRQFAKRQLTWLRAETEVSWLDSLSPRLWAQVLGRLQTEGVLLR